MGLIVGRNEECENGEAQTTLESEEISLRRSQGEGKECHWDIPYLLCSMAIQPKETRET